MRILVVEDEKRLNRIISEALEGLSAMAERHPELKADKDYARYMGAVDSYKKMVDTSRLIYNDSVTRLNRELRLFPTSLAARLLCFHARDYLERREDRTDISGVKNNNI